MNSSSWLFGLLLIGIVHASTNSAIVAGPVIGSFDSSRAGLANLIDGPLSGELRTSLLGNFPGASLTGTSTLTSTFVNDVDILLLHNAAGELTPISSLSVAEQSVLADFVSQGGSAVIIADGWYGADAANLLAPFSVTMSTLISGDDEATFIDPLAHPISNGPFGLVTDYLSRNCGLVFRSGPLRDSTGDDRGEWPASLGGD